MITINVKQVLEKAETRKKIKRTPKISIIVPPVKEQKPAETVPVEKPVPGNSKQVETSPNPWSKLVLLNKLEEDFRQAKIERAKVSNEIFKLYERRASTEEQSNLYNRILSFKPYLVDLYEKKRYVEEHGVLPEEKQQPKIDDYSLAELQLQKKKLSDLRCKLKKKLQPSAKPAKKEKLMEWEHRLAQADQEYRIVEMNIKQLQAK
jgi:hypothetical protein